MQTTVFFDELSVSYPDEFHVMDQKELERFFGSDQDKHAIINPHEHMMLSFFKTKPSFLARLTDAPSVANGWHLRFQKRLPEYQRTGQYTATLCGREAHGFSFEFKAVDKDIMQSGSLLVFKQKKYFYLVLYYGWKERNNISLPIRNAIQEAMCLTTD